MEKTVKCPICGEPYVVYPFYVGDQSACPKYVEEARKNMPKVKTTWNQVNYGD